MPGIECFILPRHPMQEDVPAESIPLSPGKSFDRISVMPVHSFRTTAALRHIAVTASSRYILLCTCPVFPEMSPGAIDRILSVAEDSSADMLYSDYMDVREDGSFVRHPLIDCTAGALRDDFDFGPLLVFRREAFVKAVGQMPDREYGALYDLRLRMDRIVHLKECLYSCSVSDIRKSGEKQFDYVDPKNRDVQIEMEAICTDYLKRTGAYLEPAFKSLPSCADSFPVTASVVIPVLNRACTIRDAVESALAQKCRFPFNVIVVDNHSTDGTAEILDEIASAYPSETGYMKSEGEYFPGFVHIVPESGMLGIGGCWNAATESSFCGKYAVQLDSDDVYSDLDVLSGITGMFASGEYAMVIGSYMMTDFGMNPIPPGKIDHKEWTMENGRNNALRINGLGAPRAFYVPVLREIGGFPNTSYGEDYAVGLRISREYMIGRIYDVLYCCRRWEGNSDADLDIEKLNANNAYKDWIRTCEFEARRSMCKLRPGR